VVLLAAVRPDFLHVVERLRFADWYPAGRIFPEEDDKDSATLKAVRHVYELLGDANTCPHCAVPASEAARRTSDKLYYLV
jgi:sulfate permease, SulP family